MNRFQHRELLLSLKASTIEASFSVPMLNLTMPSFPFIIAFAAVTLGWGPGGIGFMAALPHLCNMVQPLVSTPLRRWMSLYHITIAAFVFSALPWGFISLFPFLSERARHPLFFAILCVATMANSVASVSWSTAISDLVPARLAGRYFGRRNLVFGFWTLVTVLVVGIIADRGHNSLTTFGWIFSGAGLARLIGLFFLTRMRFPASVTERAPTPPDFGEIRAPLRDYNYLKLVAFIGIWGLILNLAQPFYTVFVVHGLHQSLGNMSILTALSGVGGVASLKMWGWLCDRFGSKPVLYVCSMIWALTGLASWTFAGERFFWHLAPAYFVVGATTAGFQLCQFQLMIKLSPPAKAPHVAVFLALSSALTALGPLLGGAILGAIPDELGTFLGQTIRNYHVLILGSMVGCLISVRVLDLVREEESHPPEAVWGAMRKLQSISPMLALSSAAEMFLTPRGLLGLTRNSIRVVRRQAKGLERVGEDLVEGTTDVIRSKLSRNR
jgi:MFS family permease